MSAEWICDGCGKRERGVASQYDGWCKPPDWYERNLSVKADGTEAEGIFGTRGPEQGTFKTILSACSRECVDRVSAKIGTHGLVAPW